MYSNTHFDESMKYITRAPILRAKTKTTYKRKEKSNYSTALTNYSFTYKNNKKKDNKNKS